MVGYYHKLCVLLSSNLPPMTSCSQSILYNTISSETSNQKEKSNPTPVNLGQEGDQPRQPNHPNIIRFKLGSFRSPAYTHTRTHISTSSHLVHSLALSSLNITMRFIIRDDAEQAAIYVANYVVDRIRHFNPSPSNPFVLGLPTGSSPLGVYKCLVEKYKAGEVSFP